MRMRLGLLHDPDAQRQMHEKEQKAAEERRRKTEAPTVRTEEEQKKHDEQKAKEDKTRGEKKEKEVKKTEEKLKVRIRPLSDARAIELGANFFSETFIFLVAVGLLLLENFRSSRSRGKQRDEVADRLDSLEAQVERLQREHNLPELEALNERLKRTREERNKPSWYNPAGWWRRTDPDLPDDDGDEGVPGEVEGAASKRIPGSVPGPSPEKAIKSSAAVESKDSTSVREGEGKKLAAAAVPPQRVDSVTAKNKER